MAARIQDKALSEIAAKSFFTYVKQNIEEDSLYAGVSYIPQNEYLEYSGSLDSESTFFGGIDSEVDVFDIIFYKQTMYSMHKIYAGGVSRVVPRVDWNNGDTYAPNDYVMIRLFESGFPKIYVYKCLFSPRVPSVNPPIGNNFEPATYDDGYVWKYIYTIQNVDSIRFLSNSWMPVPERIKAAEFADITPSSFNYSQYLSQINAIPGEVWGVSFDSDALIAYYNNTQTFRDQFVNDRVSLVGRDFSNNVPTQFSNIDLIYDSESNNFTLELVSEGKGYQGPVLYGWDSDTTIPGIGGIVAPGEGHGSNIPNEIGATNVMVTIKNIPEEESIVLYSGSKYNLISLLLNPIDNTTSAIARQDFYISAQSFRCTNNKFVVGDFIEAVSALDSEILTSRAYVIGVDGDRVYYIFVDKDSSSEFFKVGDIVQITPSGAKQNIVAEVFDRDVNVQASDLLIADYLGDQEITRSEGQIETFNFVLKF